MGYDTDEEIARLNIGDPFERLLDAIRSLSTDEQLEAGQRPIATRYLAIRNAQGDFGSKQGPRAFFTCEVKKVDNQWKVIGSELIKGTTTIRLLDADGKELIPDTTISETATSFTINLPDDDTAKALALAEAYDTPGILLQIGIRSLGA